MAITVSRPPNGCLSPIVLDRIVDDPAAIRAMARRTGPYFMPARYLFGGQTAAEARSGTPIDMAGAPRFLIGPVWRGDWAFDGHALVDGADALLNLNAFVEAAAAMCQSDLVVPQQVFVNLTTPMAGNAHSHTDVPEFHGITRNDVPGWMLLAMGHSGLFEDERITTITAVTWFYEGEGGEFTYWPRGPDRESVTHDHLWNTGVVGDNDFMHHTVERTGPPEMAPPRDMTLNTTLDFNGGSWGITEAANELAAIDDVHVRLSLSWKARVFGSADARDGQCAQLSPAEVMARFSEALGEPLPDNPSDPAVYEALISRFTPFGRR